ncbi:MAG: hypothetical protein NW215_06280 [Hyphomicrobiales bacterium]|nr:hypothetical protein [Hyphomicrobiales bacterium]
MPPIMLTRDELASLKRIAARPCPIAEIPEDHIAKLSNYGLARRDVMLLRITQLGQLETLRQRFRNVAPPPKRIVLDEKTTRTSIILSGKSA